MAYIPRYKIISDGAFFHVTWKCHNEDWLIEWDWAKEIFYDLLLKYKDKYGVEIYSYGLMDNHPHLVGHLAIKEKFSDFFRLVNSQLALRVNRRLKRRGQLVMDRFKSPTIDADEEMLTVMAYVDLNRHRAKCVAHPKENRWSSYRYYAYGEDDPLITPSPSYLALSDDPLKRQAEYRAIVEALMEHRRLINISHTYFIGNPDWVIGKYRDLCSQLGRKFSVARAIRLTTPPITSPPQQSSGITVL